MSTSDEESLEELSDFQKDALKELGTMGAGHAASALTELLERPIFMKVPSVRMVTIGSIPDLLKTQFPSEKIAISSTSNITELFYTVLVLFDKDTVNEILSQKAPPPDDIEALMEFSTMFMSLIEEFGSIILLKYILSLNLFLSVKDAIPTQPKLRIGTLESLMEYELKEFPNGSRVIFIECDVYSEDESSIRAELVLIPHSETYDRFFGALFTQYI
ncbi:MAG: chemotaxis protein CheC [Candidatus Hodarchaeota archaeon]